MPPKRTSKRWIFALLMAVLFPALAVHVSCVAVLGPGSWGSGLEEKTPELLPAASNPEVLRYAAEFSELPPGEPAQDVFDGDVPKFEGRPFWVDHFAAEDSWVVATYSGNNWTEKQQVYVSAGPAAAFQELDLARDMIIERPTLMKRGAETILVYGRWHSWNLPPMGKLGRYLKSYLDPSLRPESSLYVCDLDGEQRSYFGPGHTLAPSPDRKRGVLLRSGALGAGYYSMHLWDPAADSVVTILSLREADPGSGRSFWYRWSSDSRAVQIGGRTGGLERRRREPGELNLIYLVDERAVYQVEAMEAQPEGTEPASGADANLVP